MATFALKVLNSSFTATRTVSDTTAECCNANTLRVAVDASGNARLTAFTTHTQSSFPRATLGVADVRFGICHVYQCLTSDSTFTRLGYVAGVKEASEPFFNSTTGRFYVGLVGFRYGTSTASSLLSVGTASLLADITSSQEISSFAPPHRFRIAASIGEYAPDASSVVGQDGIGAWLNGLAPPYKPPVSSGLVLAAQGQIGILGTRQYALYICQPFDPSSTTFSMDAFSGGIVGRYDGLQPSETCFAAGPQLFGADIGGGSLVAGTYNYTAVWTYKDKESKAHFSRCGEPISVVQSGGSGKISVDVSVPGISSYTGQCTVQLYRTVSGGTQYFKVASAAVSTTAGIGPATESYINFTDTISDATLQANPLLYRQPGTSQTDLDRVSALSGKHVIRHKDRIFYAHENTVYFSNFDVDGEAPWFSPGFSFDVINGEGPITGVASMDGLLIIFKRQGIYVVDGDGPPGNGGSGNEFTPPRKLNIDLGCIDARSICNIPDGIVYRSQRGIELLTRGMKLTWIGQEVSRTVAANPLTGGTTFDHVTGRLYVALGTVLSADGGMTYTSPGVVLVYDVITQSWVKFYYTNSSNVSRNAMQDVCFANATVGSLDDNVFLIDHNNSLFVESNTSGLDNGAFTPWTIATGWVHAASKQDRIKVTDLFFLGNRYSNHNLQCQVYYDYNKANATSIRTFDATGTNLAPEQLAFQPPREACQAAKFVLTSVTPSNPATIGTGQGGEINGITIRVGPKGGGAKLPVAQKG